jgi:hypothetical protein
MEDAQKDYKKALNDMPGAWSMIGLALTDSICSTVLPALSLATIAGVAGAAMSSVEVLASVGAAAYGAKTYMNKDKPEAVNQSVEEGTSLSTADSFLFSNAKQLEESLNQMSSFLVDSKTLNDKIIQGIENQAGCLSSQAADFVLKSIQGNISAERTKGGDTKLIDNLTKICASAKELVASFSDASKKQNVTPEQVAVLDDKLKKLKDEAFKINVMLTARSNVPAIHKKGPGMLQKAKNMVGMGGKKSLVDSHLQTAHIKLEVTKEQLKSVEEQADKSMEKQLDINRRLQENLMLMAKFETEGKEDVTSSNFTSPKSSCSHFPPQLNQPPLKNLFSP